MPPMISLMTDFGEGSPYVAQMKGVMWSLHRSAVVVDVTHAIRPQSIREGAIIWSDTTPFFPPGSIHVAVVDPGVGTDRPIVAARIGASYFVAPDNGLFDQVLMRAGNEHVTAVRLDQATFWRPTVSATFHGRDIMAPVAAHLASGVSLDRLGSPHRLLVRQSWPAVARSEGAVEGEVVWIDSFGNLVTNIRETELAHAFGSVSDAIVSLGGRRIGRLRRAYADAAGGDVVALIGSSGRLEIAVVNGSAAERLEAGEGMPVRVARHADSSLIP